MDPTLLDRLEAMRRWHAEGHTRPFAARRAALRALAGALVRYEGAILEALAQDMRKPAFEAYLSEVGLLRGTVRHALAHLRQWMRPQRIPTPLSLMPASSSVAPQPLGVVLIIAPWNYPLLLTLSPLVAALAAGNCVVLKPSEDAPATAAVIRTMVQELFDPRHVAVVEGVGAAVVPALLKGFRFGQVFFTGSPRVGAIVAGLAAERLVPCTLELGGKSPVIVDRSANPDVAAKRVAWGKFFNAGQTCISPDHALVHADVYEPFLEALRRHTLAFFGPDPQRSPHLARLVNRRRFDVLRSYLDQGRVYFGGQHDAEDLFVAPTVLTDLPPEAPVLHEEIFGPVLPVLPWREREEVLTTVARNPFPLACYFFGRDRRAEAYFTERIAFGGGCINHTLLHFGSPALPMGGIGTSGMGRYQGREGFLCFSHMRSTLRASVFPDPGVQYPPYTPLRARLLRIFLR